MMATLQSWMLRVRQVQRKLRVDPLAHRILRALVWAGSGFLLSAASLGQHLQPLPLGLLFSCSGWPAFWVFSGGSLGYWVFWGNGGLQGVLWLASGLPLALLLCPIPQVKLGKALLPAAASLITAVLGLIFQLRMGVETPVLIYLTRLLLAVGSTRIFTDALADAPFARWLAGGLGVLALAQVLPTPWLCLGYAGCGLLCTAGAFPAAALGGLALDLSQITPVPMTAVACLAYFLRLIPQNRPWLLWLGPPLMYAAAMGLTGTVDLLPLPPLILGSLLGLALPGRSKVSRRRGETGMAQVRLEMTAGVLHQIRQQLLEAPEDPIDEQAVLSRSAQRACGSCPCRKNCPHKDTVAQLPAQLLHKPLLDAADLPQVCRKPGRLLQEFHRAQEQLRALRRERALLREYRSALSQQYRFLADYLRETADQLALKLPTVRIRFQVEVAFASNRPQDSNGDRCLKFSGVGGKYYVLLCDGMGTGLGAVEEGRSAAQMLKNLLTAGHPAQYALRSFNSLCALRCAAGAATVDLAEICLESGRVILYKWGAPASWLLHRDSAEKIGTAGPPPGLSVSEGSERVERLSLRRGETLLLCSDGVGGEDALSRCVSDPDQTPGELAVGILENSDPRRRDDATVAAIRLMGDLTPT